MNKESELQTDESVAAAYRKFSTEKAPPELDRVVLNEARAKGRRNFWKNFYAWRRPLAFAVTLVLGIALVYDMQTLLQQADDSLLPSPNLKNVTGGFSDSRQGMPNVQDAGSGTGTAPSPSVREVEPAAGTRNLQKGGAVQARDAQKTDRFSAERPGIEPEADREDSSGSASKRIAIPSSSVETASRKTAAEPVIDEAGSKVPATEICSEDQTTTADTWWRCVEDLRAAGREQAANAELQKLRARFPGFERLE